MIKLRNWFTEKYNRKIRNPYDLEPEEEVFDRKIFKEEYNADFVFVTHYPSKKRPFYAMDDPQDDYDVDVVNDQSKKKIDEQIENKGKMTTDALQEPVVYSSRQKEKT